MKNKSIEFNTDFGIVVLKLSDIMDNQGISIYTMSRLAKVKYEIVKKYYNGESFAFTGEILAKFCYILECDISDILVYQPSKVPAKQGQN